MCGKERAHNPFQHYSDSMASSTTNNHIHEVIIIGSGFGGICSAIKLKESSIDSFVILEKAPSVGGTWRDNTYPGCCCDIPAELYSFSFDNDVKWAEAYTSQPAVLDYIRYLVDKYKLQEHFRFKQEVSLMMFNEASSTWMVETAEGESFQGNHVISAVGQLHLPMIPKFKNEDKFHGDSFHTARFTRSLESFRNKRVAVIGSGASAIQVIPELASVAAHVEVYQRTPRHVFPKITWTLPAVGTPRWVRQAYRSFLGRLSELLLFNAIQGYLLQKMIIKVLCWLNLRMGLLWNTELRQKVTPRAPILGYRILFSNTYYPALARANVSVTAHGISHLDTTGITDTEGKHVAVDTIVYATGFQRNPWEAIQQIRGREGRRLWPENNPHCYMGIHTHGFPNLHFLYGPNTNTGHSSVLLFLEAQVALVIRALRKMKSMQKKTIEVKESVEKDFLLELDNRMKGLMFAKVKRSHYISGNGRIILNWVGGAPEYQRRCQQVEWTSYEWK